MAQLLHNVDVAAVLQAAQNIKQGSLPELHCTCCVYPVHKGHNNAIDTFTNATIATKISTLP